MSSSIHFIGGSAKLATQNSIESSKLKESPDNVMKQIMFPIANPPLGNSANLTPAPIMMSDSVSSQNHVITPCTLNVNPINLVALTTAVSNCPTNVSLVQGTIVPSHSLGEVSFSSASNAIPSIIAPCVSSNITTSHMLKSAGPLKRVEPHHVSPIQIKPQVISRTIANAKTNSGSRILPIGDGHVKPTIRPCAISTTSSVTLTNSIIGGSTTVGTSNAPVPQRLLIHSKNSKVFLAPSNKFSPNLRPSVTLSTRAPYPVGGNTVLVSPNLLPVVSSNNNPISAQQSNSSETEANSDAIISVSASDSIDGTPVSPPLSNSTAQITAPSILTRKRPLDENTTAIFALIKQSDSSQHTVISRTNTLPKSIVSHSESSPSRKRSRKQHLAEIRSEQPTPATISSTLVVSSPASISNNSLVISATSSNSTVTPIVPTAGLHNQLSTLCTPLSIHPAVTNSHITKPTVRLITDSSSISNSSATNDSNTTPTANIFMYSFINPNASGSTTTHGHLVPTLLSNNDGHLSHQDAYSATTNATILEGAEETVTSSGLSQQEMIEHGISKHFHNLPSSGHQHVGEMSLLAPQSSVNRDNYSLHYNDPPSSSLRRLSFSDEDNSNQTQYSGFFNYKRLTLSDKCTWNPRPHLYETYSEVRQKKEVKQSVNEVFFQKDIRRRTVGWPLSKVVGQYQNLIDVEKEHLSKLDHLRDTILSTSTGSTSRKDDATKLVDLIADIYQQKVYLIEGLKEVSTSVDGLIEDNWAIALDILEKSKSRRPTRRK